MNGEITKYYQYKGTSGKLTIPLSIAKALNWKHKDSINVIIKTVDGQTGLFLFKKEENKKN